MDNHTPPNYIRDKNRDKIKLKQVASCQYCAKVITVIMRALMNLSFLFNFIKKFGSVTFLLALASCSCQFGHKLLVINVLDAAFFDDCHIKGSINVPFDQLEDFAKKTNKSTPIILYCSNYRCTASVIGARMLKSLGFDNVAVYEGGTAEWYQQKLPINGPCQQAYLKMDNSAAHAEIVPDISVLTWQQLHDKMQKARLF